MAEEMIKRIQALANMSSSFVPKSAKPELLVSGSFTPETVNKVISKKDSSNQSKLGLSPLKNDKKPKKNDIF